MRVPVLENETECGTLRTEQRGLYTVFRAEVETTSLCRLLAEYESGEIVLGIPAPEQGKMQLCVSIPTSRLPAGKLLRGTLRAGNDTWTRFTGGHVGPFPFPAGYRKGNIYRFPWKGGDRLPCDELLCFYRLVHERGHSYLEISLNEDKRPTV